MLKRTIVFLDRPRLLRSEFRNALRSKFKRSRRSGGRPASCGHSSGPSGPVPIPARAPVHRALQVRPQDELRSSLPVLARTGEPMLRALAEERARRCIRLVSCMVGPRCGFRASFSWRLQDDGLRHDVDNIHNSELWDLRAIMVSFVFPSAEEISSGLAAKLRQRRLDEGLTQERLSRRSGVSLGTLKKFERTGRISLVSFVSLVIALREERAFENFLQERKFETLEQVLATPKKRKRGHIT